MKFNADLYFQTSANLLLGVAFLTLATAGRLDWFSVIGFFLAYGAYFFLNLKGRAAFLSAAQVSLYTKLYLVIFVLDLMWISRSFVDATLHLLIVIQIFKFFSLKKDRDYFYLILIAFMELLAAAAMTISATFFFSFVLFLGLVISTLISFEMKRAQSASEPTPGRRPAVRLSSAQVNGQGSRRVSRSVATASAILCAGTIGLAGLIFFGLPRVSGGFFTRAGESTQTITGFSSTVQFGDLGSIKRNMALVMRVEIEGSPKDFEGVKWRGIALNSFEGNAWYRILGKGPTSLPRIRQGLMEYYSVPTPETPPPHRIVQYRVILEPLSTEVLFVASNARSIMTQARVRMDPAGSFSVDFHPNTRIRYDAFSDVAAPNPALLLRPSNDYPLDMRKYYLSLPAVDPRIPALASKITQSDSNNYERAKSIERYLKEHYGYTLDVSPVREKDPVGRFLFETRKGYCEYFASAMAVLLRTLGIPSRVVNGFQTGEYNSVGHDFIVREADAHSWVEAYFPNYGWASFDPTPASAVSHPLTAWVSLNHYLDAMELFWINWVVGYDTFRQVTLFQDLQHRTLGAKYWAERTWLRFYARVTLAVQRMFFTRTSAFSAMRPWKHPQMFIPPMILLGVVGCAGAVFVWYWYRRRMKSPQLHQVGEIFLRWLAALSRRGFRRQPSQTPMEFSQSISDPKIRTLSIELTELYNSLRFNPSDLNSATYVRLKSKLQLFLKAL